MIAVRTTVIPKLAVCCGKKGGMKKIQYEVSWLLMFSSPINSVRLQTQIQILLISPIHGEKWEKTVDCMYSIHHWCHYCHFLFALIKRERPRKGV